jgi:hypothetical protein
MALNVAHPENMTEDFPVTEDTLRRALQAQAEGRDEARKLGVDFDEQGRTILPKKPAPVLPFLNRDADALFTSPTAMELVVTLQMKESIQADAIADAIALTVHRADLAGLTAKQKADVRFAATHALRSQSDSWRTAARTAAIAACETWMQSEGGKPFRDLSPELRHAIAVKLGPAVLCGYFGISEGSRALTPGEYLRIADGGR